MNILQLMKFAPQLASLEAGPEPTLTFVLASYYLSHGMSEYETNKVMQQYFDALALEMENE